MRSASFWVFPDPAPASTRRLRSSSRTMRSRAAASGTGCPLLMTRQPYKRRQLRVAQFGDGTVYRIPSARVPVVAPLARFVSRRVHEGPRRDDLPHVVQHRRNGGRAGSRDAFVLLLPLRAREVVLG